MLRPCPSPPEHLPLAAPSPEKLPGSPLFRALATWVLAHRALCAALLVAATVASAWLTVTRIQFDMTILAFLDKDSEAAHVLDDYRARFGRDDVFVVLVEGDVFTEPFLERLRDVHHAIAALDLPVNDYLLDQAPPARAPAAAPPADDAFADFDDFGDAGASPEAAWGDEAGGSVIDEITSLITVRRVRGRTEPGPDGTPQVALDVGQLLTPWPTPDALPALRADALADPQIVNRVVDPTGRYAAIITRTRLIDEDGNALVDKALRDILDRAAAPGFRPQLAGAPSLAVTLRDITFDETSRLFLAVFLVVMAVLFWLFRHPLGVLLPGLVVVLAAVWAFGFMAIRGSPVTMLTTILPAFLVAVGVGDAVHILSIYRDHRRRGVPNDDAIVQTIALTGKPVLFTSLTTMFGLVSFNFASITAIANLGNAGAIGVAAALLLSLTAIPLVLTLNRTSLLGAPDPAKSPVAADRIERFVSACSALSGRPYDSPLTTPPRPARRRAVLAAAALIVAIAAIGISQLRVWHDALSWVPAENPTRRAFEAVDTHLGGVATIQLLIEPTSPLGAKDLDFLRGLDALEAHIGTFRHPTIPDVVGSVVSVLDVVKETRRALHGGAPSELRLPDTQAEAQDLLFLFESADPSAMRRLATADLRLIQMTVFVKWLEATSYGPLTEHVTAGVQQHLAGLATVRATGTVLTLFTTVSSLIANLIKSFGVALILITVFMLLLVGELRLGLISMVPNLFPIVVVLGIMGFAGVPVDMSNLLVASIAIGLAVDDTIHFLHGFKTHYRLHHDVEAAISDAFRHTGRALVGTTIVLCAGFGALMMSQLASTQRFAWLTGLTAAIALLADLILGPALLRTFYGRRTRP
jgi:predicted RND superfamily exporter protein